MAVSDSVRESMSAVMDGEASDVDMARVLRATESDSEARAYWQRLQEAQTVRRTGHGTPQIDVSAGVAAALAAPLQPRKAGPLASLAVAASVTLAVVFGGQTLLQEQSATSARVVQLPGGVVPIQGVAPVQAKFGPSPMATVTPRAAPETQNPTLTRVYEQLARERFRRFGIEHARATATIQPNALVPYVRLPETPRQ